MLSHKYIRAPSQGKTEFVSYMASCWKSVGFFYLEPGGEMLLCLQWAQLICMEGAALVWGNGLVHTW